MNKNDFQFEEPKDRHMWRNRIKGKCYDTYTTDTVSVTIYHFKLIKIIGHVLIIYFDLH